MPFSLEIVTPERLTWSGEATALVLPTVDGEVGILPKHEPYVTVLGLGEGRITTKDGNVELVAIIGGFVQVRPDRVLVLAESADLAADLDRSAFATHWASFNSEKMFLINNILDIPVIGITSLAFNLTVYPLLFVI